MKTGAQHTVSAKEKIKNLAVKGEILKSLYNMASALTTVKKTAFSKGPQDNVAQTLFFRHLDVSKFFNIFVENSSPSSSVIYYFDFPTTDVIVKEK